jgi:hypothetical protein
VAKKEIKETTPLKENLVLVFYTESILIAKSGGNFFSSFLRELYLPYLHIAAKIAAVCVPLRHHLYLAKSLQQPANFETPSFCPVVLRCFNIFTYVHILNCFLSVCISVPRGEKGDKTHETVALRDRVFAEEYTLCQPF